MVGIFWTWSPWWYFQLAYSLVFWVSLFVYRKSWKRKGEIGEQLLFGFIALVLALFSDVIAVFTNLWHYTGGDWPPIVWLVMFTVGLGGFQVFKFIDERWRK